MKRSLACCLSVVLCGSALAAEPARERVCFSPAEMREKIAEHGLAEPLRLMKSTAARLQAEAIACKLCRIHEELVYELSFLRRDGRIMRIVLNAANGQAIAARGER